VAHYEETVMENNLLGLRQRSGLLKIVGMAPFTNLCRFFIMNPAAMSVSISKQSFVKCSLHMTDLGLVQSALVLCTYFIHIARKVGC